MHVNTWWDEAYNKKIAKDRSTWKDGTKWTYWALHKEVSISIVNNHLTKKKSLSLKPI